MPSVRCLLYDRGARPPTLWKRESAHAPDTGTQDTRAQSQSRGADERVEAVRLLVLLHRVTQDAHDVRALAERQQQRRAVGVPLVLDAYHVAPAAARLLARRVHVDDEAQVERVDLCALGETAARLPPDGTRRAHQREARATRGRASRRAAPARTLPSG